MISWLPGTRNDEKSWPFGIFLRFWAIILRTFRVQVCYLNDAGKCFRAPIMQAALLFEHKNDLRNSDSGPCDTPHDVQGSSRTSHMHASWRCSYCCWIQCLAGMSQGHHQENIATLTTPNRNTNRSSHRAHKQDMGVSENQSPNIDPNIP